MESILEKITLYDLLGYALPGNLLIGVIVARILASDNEDCLMIANILKDYTGYFVFLLIISGYIVGIIISEISRILLSGMEKKLDEGLFNEQNLGIPDEIIKKRLVTAGVMKDDMDEEANLKKYWGYMYADIQCDGRYQKIHNYVSAETLYKNLAVTLGLIFMLLLIWYKWYIWFLGLLMGVIFLFFRWKKFYLKKKTYTIYWFINKYHKE